MGKKSSYLLLQSRVVDPGVSRGPGPGQLHPDPLISALSDPDSFGPVDPDPEV